MPVPSAISSAIANLVRGSNERPGPPPDLTDERVLLRMYARKQQLASLRGRSATFLTGPRGIGVGLPSSDIAQAFLRASIEPPEASLGHEAVQHQTVPAPPPASPWWQMSPEAAGSAGSPALGRVGLPGAAPPVAPAATALSQLFAPYGPTPSPLALRRRLW